jgi:predicted dehydrogenase
LFHFLIQPSFLELITFFGCVGITTKYRMSQPVRIGIFGTSSIARKNIEAIHKAEGVEAVIVGSRSAERAEQYAKENNVPRSCGSYEELLADPEVDAVYMPLPTSLHLQWVKKAADKGKHILCEKPVAVHTQELIEMLEYTKSKNVAFLDGLMFQHHPRLGKMLSSISSGACGVSGVRHVNSAFAFRGNSDFFKNNIRVKLDGDPLGCLGDLGWYNVRFSLAAFGYELPSSVRGVMHSATEEGVPLHLSATMTWEDDDSTKQPPTDLSIGAPRTATFFCSFLHTEQQMATLSGDDAVIEMEDFVIPFSPTSAAYAIRKHVWGQRAKSIMRKNENITVDGNQEQLMWTAFSCLCQGTAIEERKRYADLMLKTQACVNAILESAKGNGAAVAPLNLTQN